MALAEMVRACLHCLLGISCYFRHERLRLVVWWGGQVRGIVLGIVLGWAEVSSLGSLAPWSIPRDIGGVSNGGLEFNE